MANDARVCSECGAELPNDTPRGLCPRCLLKRGLGSSGPVDSSQLSVEQTALDTEPRTMPSGTLPREGQRFGDYQLVRLLGEGGMGAVYEAEHLPSERRVALKVLTHRMDSVEARQRFLREGQLAASINHPHSVYVFGTEEIDGIPVISMELAPGGTLKDRVKEKGPLPVTEAVDVILQVIAGLEAAHAKGVLHRDVKPSNCFVDADGTVKVGDFGLSISTLARAETELTTTGRILGTPAFASPEQLRGDELDVRSDIYSVGATLFYLLTGKTPFEGDNVVKLLAAVLERPARLPAKLRREIPKELAQALLKCLEKPPAKRWENYDELRSALSPFDSTPPKSAGLFVRLMAGVFDIQIMLIPALLVFESVLGLNSKDYLELYRHVLGIILGVLYFGLLEGIWGMTPGKAVARLRVVGPNRTVIGVPKAMLRASICGAFVFLLLILWPITGPTWLSRIIGPAANSDDLMFYPILIGFALLFVTARSTNGFAALHDLLTNSRVIVDPKYQARTVAGGTRENIAAAETPPQIGPYHILASLYRTAREELLLAYDTRLLRKVWIWTQSGDALPLLDGQATMGRTGRLRWLNGRRTAEGCWDAYTAEPGKPLLDLLGERHPWSAVRGWLFDLFEAVNSGLGGHALPQKLTLDRVWITADGRAKLLDFRAPGNNSSTSEIPDEGKTPPQVFLNQVAISALEGRLVSLDEACCQKVAVPLPMTARRLLHELPTIQSLDRWAGQLKPLLSQPACVSQHSRQFDQFTGWCFLLGVVLGAAGFGGAIHFQWFYKHSALEPLRRCLVQFDELKESNQLGEREALKVYIASKFRYHIDAPWVWTSAYARTLLTDEQRRLAERIVAEHVRKSDVANPNPPLTELMKAESLLKPFLMENQFKDYYFMDSPVGLGPAEDPKVNYAKAVGMVVFAFIPILLLGQVFRGGLVLRLEEIAVVTEDGTDASRLRLLYRSLIVLGPFLWLPLSNIDELLSIPFGLLFWISPVAIIVSSLRRQDRALQDRLAGTWLVPR